MPRPTKLDHGAIEAFLSAHEGWSVAGDAIARAYSFADFSAALGFVVRVGLAAEKMDHHPDIELGWGKARVRWSTHDAGGITSLDLQLAETTDSLARGMTTPPPPAVTGDEQERLRSRLAEIVGPGGIPRFEEALTHPSYANEAGVPNNQRLEFLGDSVLGLCVSELLTEANPDADEGVLTRMRSALVNAEALARWARAEKLGACLTMGRGAQTGLEREQTNVLADAVEALVAAVFASHGLDGARALVRVVVAEPMAEVERLGTRDPKSELQERVQAAGGAAPSYRVASSRGPQHAQIFDVEVLVAGTVAGRGEGRSKRLAERAAANAALATMEQSATNEADAEAPSSARDA